MFPMDTKIRSDPSIDKHILSKYFLLIKCVTQKSNFVPHIKKWVGVTFMLTLKYF